MQAFPRSPLAVSIFAGVSFFEIAAQPIRVFAQENVKASSQTSQTSQTSQAPPDADADNSADAISPERPGFTNGTDTVPPGRYQLELGYLYQNTSDGWQHRYLDTSQFRLPLTVRTEFRIGLPAYSSTHSNATATTGGTPGGSGGSTSGNTQGSINGFEDSSISFKWRFLDDTPHRPSLALIAGTTLPTGRSGLRENTLQPQADVEASYGIGPLWTLQANAIYTRASDGGQRFNQYAGALNLNYQLTKQDAVFVETYRIAPTGADGAPNGDYADGGFTHLLGRDVQLDLSSGVGYSSGVRGDYFISAGISRRW